MTPFFHRQLAQASIIAHSNTNNTMFILQSAGCKSLRVFLCTRTYHVDTEFFSRIYHIYNILLDVVSMNWQVLYEVCRCIHFIHAC